MPTAKKRLRVLANHRDANGIPALSLRRYHPETHEYMWTAVPITLEELQKQLNEPVRLTHEPKYWLYRNRFVSEETIDSKPDEFVDALIEIMSPERGKPWPTDSSWASNKIKELNRLLNDRGVPLQGTWSDLNEMIWSARRGAMPIRHSALATHRPEELVLLVKDAVLSEENDLKKLRREVEAFENFEKIRATPREPIPEHVRMFVWQRDRGRCVKCGCQERLEFDHVIALAQGGSNTERSIQLLCESCNRQKGTNL